MLKRYYNNMSLWWSYYGPSVRRKVRIRTILDFLAQTADPSSVAQTLRLRGMFCANIAHV